MPVDRQGRHTCLSIPRMSRISRRSLRYTRPGWGVPLAQRPAKEQTENQTYLGILLFDLFRRRDHHRFPFKEHLEGYVRAGNGERSACGCRRAWETIAIPLCTTPIHAVASVKKCVGMQTRREAKAQPSAALTGGNTRSRNRSGPSSAQLCWPAACKGSGNTGNGRFNAIRKFVGRNG